MTPFSPHPVVSAIDERLSALGYNMLYGAPGETGYHWSKTRGEEWANGFLDVFASESTSSQVTFGAIVGLESTRLMQIQNLLRTWECGQGMKRPEHFPLSHPQWILFSHLDRLLPRGRAPEWTTKTDNSDLCAAEFVADFVSFGIPFLTKLNTVEAIVTRLRSIECSQVGSDVALTRSADPRLYAALLLNGLGRTDEALAELDIALRLEIDRANRLFRNDSDRREAIELRTCVVQRYRAFIQSGD